MKDIQTFSLKNFDFSVVDTEHHSQHTYLRGKNIMNTNLVRQLMEGLIDRLKGGNLFRMWAGCLAA
jgi:hypothetical protein